MSSSSALSSTESLRLNRALYRLLLNVSAFAYAWDDLCFPPLTNDDIDEEEDPKNWLAGIRALSRVQYDFWKRTLASDNEKRELIAAWKFINMDVLSWIRSASDPEYSDSGKQSILLSIPGLINYT
jgi:hypothetical protein